MPSNKLRIKEKMTNLVPGFQNIDEYYGKFTRDYEKLKATPNADNFLNFILMANHLLDWISKSSEIDAKLRERVKKDWADAKMGTDYQSLRICKDIANAGKHVTHDLRYAPLSITKEVCWPKQSWSGTLGLNSSEALVVLNDNTTIMLFKVVEDIMGYWTLQLGPSTQQNRGA
jgi:hypothetical protein